MRKETGIKLFIPCFLDQLAPHVARAVTGLLDHLNVAWGYPEDQTCCGQFAWTVGDAATARRLMRHFLRVFAGAGTILCPSASCTYMVRHCYPQLAEGPGERRAVAALASRVMELGEWLASRGPLPWAPKFEGSLVLHQSCKARQLGVLPQAREVLSRVQGLGVAHDFPLLLLLRLWGDLQPAAPRALPGYRRSLPGRSNRHRRRGAGVPGLQLPPPLAGPRRRHGPEPEILSPGRDPDHERVIPLGIEAGWTSFSGSQARAFESSRRYEKLGGAGPVPAAFSGTGFQPVRRTGKMPAPPRTFRSSRAWAYRPTRKT